jgi:Cysteine-rich CPXCG
VEDCSVCCRPINVEVHVDDDGELELGCTTDNDS